MAANIVKVSAKNWHVDLNQLMKNEMKDLTCNREALGRVESKSLKLSTKKVFIIITFPKYVKIFTQISGWRDSIPIGSVIIYCCLRSTRKFRWTAVSLTFFLLCRKVFIFTICTK